jgi:predicted molibdopterin-dependent oxidoreductase YjgC
MFRHVHDNRGDVTSFEFESQPVEAAAGTTVAAALLAGGHFVFREAGDGERRGPFCMMGTCFECLVEIDGKPNQQACQTVIRAGMKIRRQRAPELAHDAPEPGA